MNPNEFLAFENERHAYINRERVNEAALVGFALGFVLASLSFSFYIVLTGGF